MRRWPYILVVDDDADFRDGLRLALEMKGYQVEGAANGKEALDRIEQKPPLLVLLDLQMPVMNGRELLQKLRGAPDTKEIPVVIISGFGFEWEAELMGAQGYIWSAPSRRCFARGSSPCARRRRPRSSARTRTPSPAFTRRGYVSPLPRGCAFPHPSAR